VLSGSRGALLALVAGLCVLAARTKPKAKTVMKWAVLTGVLFAAFYVSPAAERLRARAHWISDERTGGARPLLWRDSLLMAMERPLRGFGSDNFVAAFPRFQSAELARAYPDFYHESPHNILLDALTSQGAGGLLALAAIAAIGIWASGPPYLLTGFIATLLAHQFIVFTAPTAFFFYLGAGLQVGQTIGFRSRPQPLETADRENRPSAPLMIPALAAVIFLIFAAWRLVAADHALAVVDHKLDAGNLRGAAEAYRRALAHSSAGVSADLHFSRRWADVAARFSDAPSRLYYSKSRQALRLSPPICPSSSKTAGTISPFLLRRETMSPESNTPCARQSPSARTGTSRTGPSHACLPPRAARPEPPLKDVLPWT
jgi:O-antigen ligase